MKRRHDSSGGFSLVELLVGTVLFTIITGAVFSLLMSAQLRYRGESNVTQAFQQANIALDQITRDVHSAGYPPANSFAANAVAAQPQLVALPFSWSPGYTNAPCVVGGSCTIPGKYDLIVETDLGDGNGVQWIRYSLQGTTLMRGMTKKVSGGDPVAWTQQLLVPYLENVLNGEKFLPIFLYTFDQSSPPPPPQPSFIRGVNITLVVQSAQADPQTGQYRTITVTGQAVRFNPNQ
jgi:type II secretory pathway pseudopilin PulG